MTLFAISAMPPGVPPPLPTMCFCSHTVPSSRYAVFFIDHLSIRICIRYVGFLVWCFFPTLDATLGKNIYFVPLITEIKQPAAT